MNLDMIGIIVSDLEESLKFYQTLGLELDKRYGDHYLELKHESVRISLNTKSMIESVYGFKPSLKGERIELAFVMSDKESLDKKCEIIKQASYTVLKEPWSAPWKQYYALVQDPDGNIISLFVNE